MGEKWRVCVCVLGGGGGWRGSEYCKKKIQMCPINATLGPFQTLFSAPAVGKERGMEREKVKGCEASSLCPSLELTPPPCLPPLLFIQFYQVDAKK